MNKSLRNFLMIIMFSFIYFLIGCTQPQDQKAVSPKTQINIAGSTTLYPAMVNIAEYFMVDKPLIQIANTQSSSGAGIKKLIEGKIDIARSSRPLSDKDIALAKVKSKQLKMHSVAFDALVIVIHPEKAKVIKSLTLQQVKSIFFDGTIKDWSQLNTSLSGPIDIYVRDANESGTAKEFNEHITGTKYKSYVSTAKTVSQTPETIKSVEENANGMSYASFVLLKETVAPLSLANNDTKAVYPNAENIRTRTYPLMREVYLITEQHPDPSVIEIIAFALGHEGQKIFSKHGFISLR